MSTIRTVFCICNGLSFNSNSIPHPLHFYSDIFNDKIYSTHIIQQNVFPGFFYKYYYYYLLDAI